MYSIVYSMCFLYSIGVPSLKALQNRVCKAKASNARKGAGGTITTLLELQNFTQPLLMGPPAYPVVAGSVPSETLITTKGYDQGCNMILGPMVTGKTAMFIPQDCLTFRVDGGCFTGYQQMKWINQLVGRPKQFNLHSDGKHKLHHGPFILITIGTHSLSFGADNKLHNTFVPLVYLMCKQHESEGACLMLCRALNSLALSYFGAELQPGCVLSDHPEAFKTAYGIVWPSAPFGQCWPHIARKFGEGAYCTKTWVHFEAAQKHLWYIHHAHTDEQKVLVIHWVGKVRNTYRIHGITERMCILPHNLYILAVFLRILLHNMCILPIFCRIPSPRRLGKHGGCLTSSEPSGTVTVSQDGTTGALEASIAC